MRLLISVINKKEALEAVKGGAHIIDVKNPREGSLGANFPSVIRKVKAAVPKNIEVSATIGDLPNLPGTASLAALGAAVSGVDYVKAGLYGVSALEEGKYLMRNVCRAVKDYDDSVKVVAVGYADFTRIKSIPATLIPEVAYRSNSDVAMLDTAIKDGKSLLNFLNPTQLSDFIKETHNFGLLAALAGGLKSQDVPTLCKLGVDVIGVRGLVCTRGDRFKGEIQKELVERLLTLIKNQARV